MLKGIFINGLKDEIQVELKLHAGGSLDELMDKALLIEEKNNALKKGGLMNSEKKGSEKHSVKSGREFTRWERGGNKEGSSSRSGEGGSGEKRSIGLSQNEFRERSRKGLCFKCGENWGKDHVCKRKHYQLIFLENSDEEVAGVGEEEEVELELTAKVMQLSLKSKEGLTSNRSFKIIGLINGVEVLVLVDCGASGNFISKRIVKQLNLVAMDTPEFVVEVGNGEKVRNIGVCKNLLLEIQGVAITEPFFLMELGGTDVVLGMDWLESLGEVKANFRNLELNWGKGGAEKKLRGDPSLCRTQVSWKALVKAMQDEGEGFVLSYLDGEMQDTRQTELIETKLDAVLEEFGNCLWNLLLCHLGEVVIMP